MFDTIFNFCNVKQFKNNSVQPYIPNVFFKKEEKNKIIETMYKIMSNEILKGINPIVFGLFYVR